MKPERCKLRKEKNVLLTESCRTRLSEIINSGKFPAPIIIFLNSKKGVDNVSALLKKQGHYAVTLHGGKSQEQRFVGLKKKKKENTI